VILPRNSFETKNTDTVSNADIVILLREILIELRTLIAHLHLRRSTDRDDDRELLERLLPAIIGKFGSLTFKTSELFADPALRALIGDRKRSQVGTMLAKAAETQRVINGYMVSRPGEEHRAACWSVVKVV
jgi:hypothetical protein